MNTRPLALLAALGLLAGCPAEDKDNGTDDTAIGTDTDGDTADTDSGPCESTVLSLEPADGATAVYYRDPIVVSFEGDGSSADLSLTDAGGAEVPFETEWTDGNVQAFLTTVLDAESTYTLSVDVCGAASSASFTTSSLGAPLAVGAEDMVGNTYVFRLSDSTITEPAFLDLLASSYLTLPLLISVTAADETSLDLLGGVGELENDGTYTQVISEETWDFPAGDFSEQPYFEAFAEYITLSYNGILIPIEEFHLSGTFTADGTAIERGVGSGLGDSRYMAPLVGRDAGDLAAVCEIAAGAGVSCEPCADGEPYCIYIVAEDITAVLQDGLTLTPVDAP
jgi:hypothetical protein